MLCTACGSASRNSFVHRNIVNTKVRNEIDINSLHRPKQAGITALSNSGPSGATVKHCSVTPDARPCGAERCHNAMHRTATGVAELYSPCCSIADRLPTRIDFRRLSSCGPRAHRASPGQKSGVDSMGGGVFFTARCTTVQSAVLLSHVVCPSVCLSVCL